MLYAIWLSRLKGFSLKQKRELVSQYGSFEGVFDALKAGYVSPNTGLEEAKRILEACNRKGIFIKAYADFGVQDRPDLPLILYCRGNWKETCGSVGIVGTRRCTEYGKKITSETASLLAKEGVAIISGMAKGIDACAHSAAIKAGGYTVAVLGNGPDICFPSEHRSLMEAIIDSGLIVSEYPPGFPGSPATFPQRNRIIAAFSDRLLVVESRKKGGALITAKLAKRYGKQVFAVPGRLDSLESEGTNMLIAKDGAKLWLPEYCRGENTQLSFTELLIPDHNENRIMAKLKAHQGSICLTDLASELDLEMTKLMEEVTELEIEDAVYTEGDVLWLR